MKILAIGNFKIHHFAPFWQGIKLGFENLGWDIKCLDARIDSNIENKIRQDIKERNPEVILFATYDCVNNGILKRIAGTAKIVLWYCDISVPERNFGRRNDYSKQPIDLMFVSNREQIPFWERTFDTKTYFMPQACMPTEWIDTPYKDDLIFIGQHAGNVFHERRQKILDGIPNIKYYPNKEIDEPSVYKILTEIYRGAKISLGVSAFNDIDLYTSDRLFLSTGNCGFHLCEYFKGIEELYKIGYHLDTFRSSEEAREKIEFYMRREDSREKIRRQGFEQTQQKHNYPERVKNVADIIQGKTEEFYGFL